MTPESLPAESQPKGMGEFGRLSAVFFEPKKAFADIAERPTWLVPVVLLILAGLGYVTAVSNRIGWESVVRQQMESRAATMSAQQRDAMEKTMAITVKITTVSAYAGVVLFLPLGLVIAGGILTGIANGLMSAGIRFKQVLAALAYAMIPTLISSILAIVVVFLKNPDDFNVNNPVGFNPGAYMDPQTTGKFVYSLAGSLDVFTLWVLALAAMGLKAAAGKRLSGGGAFGIVFVPWIILVFGKAALTSAFS